MYLTLNEEGDQHLKEVFFLAFFIIRSVLGTQTLQSDTDTHRQTCKHTHIEKGLWSQVADIT